ncbi:unnamed protein product [Effrenium voratum]|nr:unnamed protein product [Effrenium voratum]
MEALSMLQQLSALQQEDENLRAKEDIDALTPFKLAKAPKDKELDVEEGEQQALFPGEDQAEALAALGLNEDGEDPAGDGEVTGGSSLYDLWSHKAVKKKADADGQSKLVPSASAADLRDLRSQLGLLRQHHPALLAGGAGAASGSLRWISGDLRPPGSWR